MPDKQDKLELLKSKYLERIRQTERDLTELKQKVLLIEELETESESLDVNSASAGAYRMLGLTEAVLDAVQLLGSQTGVSSGQVAKHLLKEGFKPKGKNFNVSVGTTLKRLAKSKITTELKDGRRLY